MTRFLLTFLLAGIGGFGLAGCQTQYAVQPQETTLVSKLDLVAWEQAAQARVKPFAGQLLSAVQGAMQVGGATQAITVCTELAPALAQQASTDGWTVGRISDRVRQPNNAADAWESAVLAQFAAQVAAGQPVAELKHSAVVEGEYRYMQAIGIAPPCLACHGQNLAPDVQASLAQAYPKDRATGYQVGQLRGAFSLRKALGNVEQ
ncbi:MAG: DUF3365 domain-containing protein [Pseudomonadota bacterium]|nr:DUF3365 domain-containing protein [Pseudomonadota bacterium]